MRIPIIALSVLLAALSSCKGEGRDHKNDALAVAWWVQYLDSVTYNNCSPWPTVLGAGPHAVPLAEGQEYWFGIWTRSTLAIGRQYQITVQEQPGQDVKAVYMSCMADHRFTRPQPPFTMGTDYLPDSGNPGALETYSVEANAPLFSDQFAIVVKSVTGSGTITLTIPNSSL